MLLKAWFHIHSRYSFDSFLTVNSIIDHALKNDIHVVSVTDHGSIEGSITLEKEIARRGLPICPIIGAEYASEFGDIIGLFLKREVYARRAEEIVDEIHHQNGVAVLPHPATSVLAQHPDLIKRFDFIEVFNGRLDRKSNAFGQELAQGCHKKAIIGLDAHFAGELDCGYIEVRSDKNVGCDNIKDAILGAAMRPIFSMGEFRKEMYLFGSRGIKAFKKKDPLLLCDAIRHLSFSAVRRMGLVGSKFRGA